MPFSSAQVERQWHERRGAARINIPSPLRSGKGVVSLSSPCFQDTSWWAGIGICALTLPLFLSSTAPPFLHPIWRAPIAKALLPITAILGQVPLNLGSFFFPKRVKVKVFFSAKNRQSRTVQGVHVQPGCYVASSSWRAGRQSDSLLFLDTFLHHYYVFHEWVLKCPLKWTIWFCHCLTSQRIRRWDGISQRTFISRHFYCKKLPLWA